MLKNNEYFGGSVKSIGFTDNTGNASVGVMEAGEYEFGTDGPELMIVISGKLTVMLPGATEWHSYPAGTEFKVAGKSKFQLKVVEPSSYLCRYL